MKAAVRCESLDMAGLIRAEKHGKREDWIGKQRKIRDVKPLVVGGLNLVPLYEKHVAGARQNKGAKKPVLHFIVRFPPEVLTDDGPSPFSSTDRAGREKMMVRQAVRFIDETHGGQAVFAARLDRDEAGETIVDVFACPKYMKPSKSERRDPALWTSATKFGEDLARKHQDHIRKRLKSESARAITSPRAVGMALQQDFAEFFERENGVKLEPRKLKETGAKDRISIEAWRLAQIEKEAVEARQERDSAVVERDEAQEAQKDAEARENAAKEHAKAIAAAGLALVSEMSAETVRFTDKGKVTVRNAEAIKPGLPELMPLIKAAAAVQRDRDEKRAFIARQIDNLATAMKGIRSAIPAIRHMLQNPFSPPKERETAKLARKEVVRVSPIIKKMLKRANDDAKAAGVTLPPENPGPDTDVGGPGF